MELGGKSPNVGFEDADLEQAVFGAISGIFAATGQTCIAGSRLLVQRSIHDEFVEKLLKVASKARMGDPMHPDTQVGPVTTPPQYQTVLDYIGIAQKEGAVPVLGGKRGAATSNPFVLRWLAASIDSGSRSKQVIHIVATSCAQSVDHVVAAVCPVLIATLKYRSEKTHHRRPHRTNLFT